jgi:hypothetical protein
VTSGVDVLDAGSSRDGLHGLSSGVLFTVFEVAVFGR